MDEGDNLFVINQTDEDLRAAAETAEGTAFAASQAADTKQEPVASGSAEGLIPLCVQHASGPQMNTATFGYDIAQLEKRPWAEPGAKLTDYFNYGFNEGSWRLYCMLQADGEDSLLAQAQEVLHKLERSTFHQEETPSATVAPPGGAPMLPLMHTEAPRYGGEAAAPAYSGNPAQPPAPLGAYQDDRRPFRTDGGAGAPQHSSYKTRLCQRFAEGRCTHGADCNYAHGSEDLRVAPMGAGPRGGGGGGNPGMMMMGGMYGPPLPQQVQHPRYPVPSFHPGGAMPPMPDLQQAPSQQAGGDASGGGFRVPKRARTDQGPGEIYEPQY